MNWNYLNKVDEKMYFYMKHLLFYNILTNVKNKFDKKMFFDNNQSILFKHITNFHSNYLIYYKNFYFCLSFNLLNVNSLKQTIFFSYNILKLNVFILKKKIFFFLKIP